MDHIFIVAINKYRRDIFGNVDLRGCINDGNMAERFLPENANCRRLDDEAATVQAITDTLGTFALECKKGDRFWFFTSSHGTAVDTPQGRHTCRVAHDGILYDYQVAEQLARFQDGVTCIVMSDCCHSEGNSRTAMLPPEDGATKKVIEISKQVAGAVPEFTAKLKYKATIYHLSACKADQVAWEVSGSGRFTKMLDMLLFAYKAPVSLKTAFKALSTSITGQTPTLKTINGSKNPVPKL